MNIWEGDNPSIYIVLPNFTIIIESDRDIGFLISYSDIDMEFIINGNSNKLKMRWDIYMNSYLLESDSNNGLSFQAKITDIQANISIRFNYNCKIWQYYINTRIISFPYVHIKIY